MIFTRYFNYLGSSYERFFTLTPEADELIRQAGWTDLVFCGIATESCVLYCPPIGQHPRIIVAGDLRSARFQRIMTALGSGSEAALHAYYATRELLP